MCYYGEMCNSGKMCDAGEMYISGESCKILGISGGLLGVSPGEVWSLCIELLRAVESFGIVVVSCTS